jgi:hypothetical protein
MTSQRPSLAETIGGNFRRIRTINGLSQNELARYGRDVGLRWNAAKVGDFEAGRSAPTLATALAVLWALQSAISDRAQLAGRPAPEVRMADLFQGSGYVAVNDALDVPAGILRDVCSGEAPDPGRIRNRPLASPSAAAIHAKTQKSQHEIGGVLQRSGLAEERLAKTLQIEPARLAHASFRLWQSTFSEERDRRAGPDANQQKRGRISRDLRAELGKALADGND